MLVMVKGFGSIWERRFGNDRPSARRFARAAFYNTTGVSVNGRMRYRWRVGGKIRLNNAGGFNPHCPLRSLNHVFECKEPETNSSGWTLILFQKMLSGPERPDFYLFAVTADVVGRLDVESSCWKSDPVRVIALSQHGNQQEAMLLMPAYSWVRGELGTFYVEPARQQFWSAELRLGRAGLAK